ncbi:retrovirus-related pol polyprotein from transposon TNT 1-94 [Tanacetum coccineum]|uniref:Retrovirus-related pol polyprotein from transposon TNT 1-94 n=1 Tax=Tanacetum coccineum TaxID=301880 RepID=A0ABQ4YH67_9ASTR
MQHVNIKILKENKNLRTELKELTAITETWLNRSNIVNQCISEQIPSQNKRILGVDQLTKDPSSSGQKDLVFVKSLADDIKVSIPGVARPWLSEAEGFILPNHDTGRILPAESQRNTIDPLVDVTDSSTTDYNSTDESSACITHLPPLKKLDGAEPVSGPMTIKSILSSSASKVNLALAGKLKSVKIEDDPHLAIVIKELNDLKLQISKNQSSYSRSCGSSSHTTTDHYDIKWFKRGEALQAKKAEALKSTRAESSNANRSKTPTKRWKILQYMIQIQSFSIRDESGIVIIRKIMLDLIINQHKGINFDKTYAPVARLEAIRIFLANSTYMNFIVYQMDVKSAFLNDKLKVVHVK